MRPPLKIKQASYMYRDSRDGELRTRYVGKVHLVNEYGGSLCGKARRRRDWSINWSSPSFPGNVTCLSCLRKITNRKSFPQAV